MKQTLRAINRSIQDYLRPKRIKLGKMYWDKKNNNVNCPRSTISRFNIIKELNIKSILFLRNDGKIGDMVVNTLIFYNLKTIYPELRIGIVTQQPAMDIIVDNPHIDNIYKYHRSNKEIRKLSKTIKSESYDLVVDFSDLLRVKQMMFINLCSCKYNLGFNKSNWNLFNLDLIYDDTNKHISAQYLYLLRVFGVKCPDLNYDLHIPDIYIDTANKFKAHIGETKLVIINPYGASKHRTLNKNTLCKIIDQLLLNEDIGVSFVFPPNKLIEIKDIMTRYNNRVYLNDKLNGINSSIGLLNVADCIISPDTSIVHLGVALNKNMVAIYRNGDRCNSLKWGPNSNLVTQIYSKEATDLHEESDINLFNVEELIFEVNKKLY